MPSATTWATRSKIEIKNNSFTLEPKFRPYFKVRPEVARDEDLKDRVKEIIDEWQPTKALMPLLEWWEVVKREVRKEAKVITRKRNRQRKQRLTFLMLLQAHLAKNITNGQFQELEQYRSVQMEIREWFDKEAEEILMLANVKDAEESEKTRIYHHERLYNTRKRSSILKLTNPEGDLVVGHEECAKLLNEEAKTLLDSAPTLQPNAQEELLDNLTEVFTKEDNEMLEKEITDDEVKESLLKANRSSAPGSDGLSFLLYIQCWESLGPHLCEVLREVVKKGDMCESMKHTFLVFSPKIGKESSTKVKDLRKLSLLQTDFKVLSGVLVNRLKKTERHTLSEHQYSTGGKKITHGVCRTRNAIESVKSNSKGCAIFETDFCLCV